HFALLFFPTLLSSDLRLGCRRRPSVGQRFASLVLPVFRGFSFLAWPTASPLICVRKSLDRAQHAAPLHTEKRAVFATQSVGPPRRPGKGQTRKTRHYISSKVHKSCRWTTP